MATRTIDNASRLNWIDWAKSIAIYLVVFGAWLARKYCPILIGK